jgi:transcriptional regulator with XRE-family HTH domain
MRKYPARHRAVISAIRDIRREKGVSQRALSERLGEVHNYINMIEKGQRNVLAEELIEIALALGADPLDLLARILKRHRGTCRRQGGRE